MAVHICDPHTWEVEAGGWRVQDLIVRKERIFMIILLPPFPLCVCNLQLSHLFTNRHPGCSHAVAAVSSVGTEWEFRYLSELPTPFSLGVDSKKNPHMVLPFVTFRVDSTVFLPVLICIPPPMVYMGCAFPHRLSKC